MIQLSSQSFVATIFKWLWRENLENVCLGKFSMKLTIYATSGNLITKYSTLIYKTELTLLITHVHVVNISKHM